MKLAIVGSRAFGNPKYVTLADVKKHQKLFDLMIGLCHFANPIEQVISGGAEGADKLAANYAVSNGLKYREFCADWDAYGKKAGAIRNAEIVDAADKVIAFWDGQSKGTKITIDICKKKKVPYKVITFSYTELDDKQIDKLRELAEGV